MISDQFRNLLKKTDIAGLAALLAEHPHLANEPIPLDDNPAKAHPLHRICDGVFAGIYTDKQAVDMAKVLLTFGASVDGDVTREKSDTPLIAAASLHADEVGLLYIDHGANIHHGGCHGGTALHWAAWCGRDRLVSRLIKEKAEVNKRCLDFASTPLLWAVHGFTSGGPENRHKQIDCVRMLLDAGADKTIPNRQGMLPAQFLSDEDLELKEMLE